MRRLRVSRRSVGHAAALFTAPGGIKDADAAWIGAQAAVGKVIAVRCENRCEGGISQRRFRFR